MRCEIRPVPAMRHPSSSRECRGLVPDAGRAIRHANETLFRVRDVAVEVTAHERRHVGKVFVVIHGTNLR